MKPLKRYYAFDKKRREWITHGTYSYGTKHLRDAGSWDKESAIKGIVTRKLDDWFEHLGPKPNRDDIVIVCIDIAPLLAEKLREAGVSVEEGGAA